MVGLNWRVRYFLRLLLGGEFPEVPPGESPVKYGLTLVKRHLFGGNIGILIFTGSLLFLGVTARVDVFINDTYTLANTLLTVAGGDLAVTTYPFGPPSGDTPGIYVSGGKVVGRNYGQIAATLPIYFLLSGLTLLFDLRALLLGAWVLLLFYFLSVVFRTVEIGSQRVAGVVALFTFALNLPFWESIDQLLLVYVALQLTTMIITAGIGVIFYRLFRTEIGTAPAAIVGVFSTIATPIGLFGTIPKRHSFTVFFLMLGLFFFYKSRVCEHPPVKRRFKALTYATVGGLSWVHGPEGFVLLVALLVGDLSTSREFRPGEIGFALGGLLISLLPFLLTNTIISGNPMKPPRLLENYRGEAGTGANNAGQPPTDNAGQPPADDGGQREGERRDFTAILQTLLQTLIGITTGVYTAVVNSVDLIRQGLSVVVTIGTIVTDQVTKSATKLTNPQRVWTVFFRRGYVTNPISNNPAAVNLSVLESMPTLGILMSAFVAGWPVTRGKIQSWYRSPFAAVDISAIVYVGFLLLLAGPALPIHVSYTARYIQPVYPIGLYFLARIPTVHRSISENWRQILVCYVGTVIVIIPVYTVGIVHLAAVPGEAVQLYAITSFTVGSVAMSVGLLQGIVGQEESRLLTTLTLGVGFGLITAYTLTFSVVIYGTEQNLLPMIEFLSEQVEYTS